MKDTLTWAVLLQQLEFRAAAHVLDDIGLRNFRRLVAVDFQLLSECENVFARHYLLFDDLQLFHRVDGHGRTGKVRGDLGRLHQNLGAGLEYRRQIERKRYRRGRHKCGDHQEVWQSSKEDR